jgi:glycosyltransferase involved in cell wall biosynthesis
MNILHVTTFLQGGAGRVVTDLAVEQRRRGHHVTVVASRTEVAGYAHYDEFVVRLARAGVPLWLVDSTFHRDHAANLRAADLLIRLSHDAPPHVVHTHAAIPSLVAVIAAGHLRRPAGLLQTMHGWGVAKTPSQIDTDIRVLNLLDRVAVPSTAAADELVAIGVTPSLLRVVPYGIDADATEPTGESARLAEFMDAWRRRGTFVACCVGTIGERKQQALLVGALARIAPSLDVRGVFIGDGDQDSLRTLVHRANLDGRVTICGYTPAARALVRHADALVLPSRSEGQPLAVLEAMADRVLVIASDIPALTEIVRDGRTGLVHGVDDAESLAAALTRAQRMAPGRRRTIVNRAAQLHASQFALEAMQRRYLDEYHAVARGSAALRRAG